MAARCSRVGTRWTTELADVRAPLYIHIYTSHFDTDALLHPLVVGGVAAAAAAAANGGGICGGGNDDDDDGDGDSGGGGACDAGGCAFFRECSSSALNDDRQISRYMHTHPSESYIRFHERKSFNFLNMFIGILNLKYI